MQPKREHATNNAQTYMVTSSTWERRGLFRNERWARLLIETLYHYRGQAYLLHEFVVMHDHIHVLITPLTSLEKTVQFIKGGFSYRAKKELSSSMEVWQKGFQDHRVRDADDYALHVSYIHNNPVKERFCERAGDFLYSSAHPGFGLDPVPQGLKPQELAPAAARLEGVPFQSNIASQRGPERVSTQSNFANQRDQNKITNQTEARNSPPRSHAGPGQEQICLMSRRTDISKILILGILSLPIAAFADDAVDIQTAHNSIRELQEKRELQQLLKKYDVSKYTFTRKVIIEERAMNHAFPVLTLNVHFLDSDDELLSSFLHEQLHWYLAEHRAAMEDAVRQLKAMYPHAPVGLPEGADSEYSTYGHLIDCYLEIQADRAIIGPERTAKVIQHKPWYTWIYKTILKDEDKITVIVKAEHLELNAIASNSGVPNTPVEITPAAVVVKAWAVPCNEEMVKPNFDLRTQLDVTGQLTDPATAPLENSKVILRKADDKGKFVDYQTVFTDKSGRFDLGSVRAGRYRFLPAPNRGWKQPIEVACNGPSECDIKLVLQLNPTDQEFGGCPIQ